MSNNLDFQNGYSDVNGIKMYYEIYGQGKPLVLIHGGGSTIQTTFGRIIPFLARKRQVIGVELQAHGRTNDRDSHLSFSQDADDVVSLLQNLNISKTDVLGFSNGGQTSIELALRHLHIINRLIICSALYKRSGSFPQFWDIFENARLEDMPQALKDGFLEVNNNNESLLNMFNRDVYRMKHFKDWTDADLQSIKRPTLIMNGNQDVGSIEHAVEMYRMVQNSELAILPGGHGKYLGEITTLENGKWTQEFAVSLIEEFLDK